MTTVYLIRHAEAEGNLYRRMHGWYDALITDNGWKQIAALEKRFVDIPVDAVYSSDLYRTMATARAVYRPKGLELRTDPDLREINLGDWEDKPFGLVRHFEGAELTRFNASDPTWRAPNGENLAQAGARAEGAIRRIAAAHPDQTVAVFCHGTVIRQLTANLKGLSPQDWNSMGHSDNTAVTCMTFEGETCSVIFESDNSHLDPAISTLARQAWWRTGDKKAEDVNLWYRPLDFAREEPLYRETRQEVWHAVHGAFPDPDGSALLDEARAQSAQDPQLTVCAMTRDQFAGLLQLDRRQYAQEGAGYISFCCMAPAMRAKGFGVQLLGQAISYFRPLGRQYLRLRCASCNTPAQHFYAKHGFVKIGQEEGAQVPVDLLEKYIGFDR